MQGYGIAEEDAGGVGAVGKVGTGAAADIGKTGFGSHGKHGLVAKRGTGEFFSVKRRADDSQLDQVGAKLFQQLIGIRFI